MAMYISPEAATELYDTAGLQGGSATTTRGANSQTALADLREYCEAVSRVHQRCDRCDLLELIYGFRVVLDFDVIR